MLTRRLPAGTALVHGVPCIGPDADVVDLALQPHPVPHTKRLGHLARQLEPPGPVEHGVLDGVAERARVVGRAVPQRLGRRPAVADRDRPAHHRRHRRVVRHDEHRHAELAVGRLQRAEHRRRRFTVEFPGRLVGEQHGRRIGQRHPDGDPLLLAAGHLVGPPSRAVRHAEQAEQLAGPGPPDGPPGAGQPERQVDVLRGRQVRQQVARRLLPDEPDHRAPVAEPLPRGHRRQVTPGDPDRACRGYVEPGEDVHQRGLAAARRADERGELPGPDHEVEALQRLHLDALGGVDPHQPVADDQRARSVVVVDPGGRGEGADSAGRLRRLQWLRKSHVRHHILPFIRRPAGLP